ncbi:AAA family ATPase, partial [Streptomyces sp. SID7760]|nr:AAA family ATPase [Streptomyces sp. SID7760]
GIYEEPPAEGMTVSTPWGDLWLSPADWTEAFEEAAGVPHNEAREQIWDALLTILMDKLDEEDGDGHGYEGVAPEQLRGALLRDEELVTAVHRAWPLLEAPDLVADLWSVPAYLRLCAPWLAREEVRLL